MSKANKLPYHSDLSDKNVFQLSQMIKFIIQFVQQRMNQKTVKNSFFNLPSCDYLPQINHSLKLINTHNALPLHPDDNTPLPHAELNLDPPEDSLGEGISLMQTMLNTTAKKKKGGCTCKKTFCLKMYCECFSTGKSCGDDCGCTNCKNVPEYRSEVLNAKSGVKEGGLRNCSLSKKRCNCKKSHCLKRYCQCYNSGVGCSEFCKCEGCQNHPKIQKYSSDQSQKPEQKEQLREPQQLGFPPMNEYKSVQDFQKFYT